MPSIKKMLALAAAFAFVGLAGCDNTAQGVKEDARENQAAAEEGAADVEADTADERAEIKEEGREAGAAIAEAGRDIGDAAERAGDKIAGAANDAAPTVDAAKQTLDVKAALMADSSIDASRIDVDTSAATRTVTLKGSVATAGQKATAERIAKSKASGYTVRNMLTVAR